MPIILDKLSYSYYSGGRRIAALCDVSLEMGAGDYLGITGAPGSGKTTLALLVAGLLKPESGRVLINGEDINGRRYDRAGLHCRLGLLFNNPEQQLFERSVEKDVAFGIRAMGLGKEETRNRVRAALEMVGLGIDELGAAVPLGLPFYQQRLVAMAGLLVSKPDILVLDEPLCGLDACQRRDFLALVDGLNAQGKAIVFISTDTDPLSERASRVAMLKEGRLVRTAWTREAFMDYFELLNTSVDVPAVREAVHLLRQRGISMPENVVTYEQFIDRLKIIMWRKET